MKVYNANSGFWGWQEKGYTKGNYWIKRQKKGGKYNGARLEMIYNHGDYCTSRKFKEYNGMDFWFAVSDIIEKSIECGNYERITIEYYERGNFIFDWQA